MVQCYKVLGKKLLERQLKRNMARQLGLQLNSFSRSHIMQTCPHLLSELPRGSLDEPGLQGACCNVAACSLWRESEPAQIIKKIWEI